MKTNYVCEKCGKSFSSAAEAMKCEAEHERIEKKNKELAEQKSRRKAEIISLYDKYREDYGESPIPIKTNLIDYFLEEVDTWPNV